MTPRTSIARAGHSNFLIGGLAALSIIALVLSVLFAVKQSGDNRAAISAIRSNSSQHDAIEHDLIAALRSEVRCITRWARLASITPRKRIEPRLSCRLRLPRTPPPATVTVRPAPSTVHVTATVTAAALRVPGPTVTRTLTRTRTVTTTAPPGRRRTKTVTAAVTVTCRPPRCHP